MKNSSTASSSPDSAADPHAGGASGRRALRIYLLLLLGGTLGALAVAEALLRSFVVPIDDSRANRVHLVYTSPLRDSVLGDSHLYRAFLNSETFANLARPGSSPAALEIVAREYYRHREPGRVVVQASPQLFNRVVDARGTQRHEAWFGLHRLGLPFAPYVFEPGISHELASLRDLQELRHRFDAARGRKQEDGPFVEREAELRRALPDAERREQTRRRIDWNRSVERVEASASFAAYRRMLELLVERGARVCLAATPVTGLYLEMSRDEPRHAEADAALRSLARELALPFVDFSDLDLALDDVESFTNPDHLTTAAGGAYAARLEAACFPERSAAQGSGSRSVVR